MDIKARDVPKCAPVDQAKNRFSSGGPVLIGGQMTRIQIQTKKGYLPFFVGSKRRVRRSGNGLAPDPGF
jgi:hypothetical protein